jgi:hypothetical protein
MNDPSRIREIKDENGDLLFRVWEENPGTMLGALRCESPREVRQAIDYPENWHRLSDVKLCKLCRSADLLEER